MRIEEWEKKLTSEQRKVYKQERRKPESEVNSIHKPKQQGRFPYHKIEEALNKLLAPEHQFEVDKKALKKSATNTKYNAKKRASQTTTGSSMGKEPSKAAKASASKLPSLSLMLTSTPHTTFSLHLQTAMDMYEGRFELLGDFTVLGGGIMRGKLRLL